MEIVMPGRIVDRHVGGNTTYSRALRAGLENRGHVVRSIPARSNPVWNLIQESRSTIGMPAKERLFHFTADTGPFVRSRSAIVLTVHGVASRWISTTARKPHQELVWRSRVRAAVRAADLVLTVSESSSEDIRVVFGVPVEKLRVIYHGISMETCANDGVAPKGTENLPGGGEFLLYLGNIEPRKNLVALIEAVTSCPDLHLVVAGKPAWNYSESMRAIGEASNVTYVGFANEDEKRWLLKNCSAFVFPSLYEGFGFPVLEAMALGVPVLCSRRGSLAEIAGPAYELDIASSEGIAHTIKAGLGDTSWLESIKRDGPVWAQKFTWDRSVAAHIAAYREVLR